MRRAQQRAAAAAPALTRAARSRVGELIEALIALLDQADGDPDLEDGDLNRCLAGEDGPKNAVQFDRQWREAV